MVILLLTFSVLFELLTQPNKAINSSCSLSELAGKKRVDVLEYQLNYFILLYFRLPAFA